MLLKLRSNNVNFSQFRLELYEDIFLILTVFVIGYTMV